MPFISNQSKYNALFPVIEPDLVATCQELGIGQICFSPIEQGVLTGDLLTRAKELAPLAEPDT